MEKIEACNQMKVARPRDDFRTFLGDLVTALPQIELPSGLNL